MRHRNGYRKLNKAPAARKALLRGLATQLVRHGRIETTVERAKELRKVVEPLVTLARKDTVANRRTAASRLYGSEVVKRLFKDVGPANEKRPGGYTRILKLGFRPGDHARRAIVEFVEENLIPGGIQKIAAPAQKSGQEEVSSESSETTSSDKASQE